MGPHEERPPSSPEPDDAAAGDLPMTANDRLLRVAEAAELLNLSTYTTYEYARRGLIPSIRIGSGRVGRLRFPEAKLRAAIDQMRKASA